ncbi:hypothetical protein QUC32_13010 [Novosphingobium resinovorum]|uniref:hypothetical protein n=1 Tax=Novosphingobium TaxID=165696 RepID=UPI001B3C96C1|nr:MULTISPECIES: hypothetical protein [Novosphingobium]MBF7010597.1 hypothetical protein [Novosphingobium sp. HR1a]WJM28594.1 hypothetical protein QUC32_13010 [Novosphingobium resinovorum]
MPKLASPATPAGDFPVVGEADLQGGYRAVATLAERDAIPVSRRKSGMQAYVRETDRTYVLSKDDGNAADPGTWAETLTDTFFGKLRRESSPSGSRWRIGNRVYGTLDAAVGFYFRKLRLPAAATVDDNTGMALADRLLSSPVGSFLRRPAGETAGPGSTLRVKIGNRIYATVDAANGLFPRKLTLPMTSRFEDGSAIAGRLVGANAGDKIKGFGGEPGIGGSIRWRIGNRLYATLDRASGFYPRKATLPASAKVDDDLTSTLASRLVAAGVGAYFRRLTTENGGVVRLRWKNRLLGQYTKASGFMWTRQTLPIDCKIADQPGVNLVDRLSGSGRAASANASYIAMAAVMANGRVQITSRRRSDSALIQITPASALGSYRNPVLTSDDKVLFDSDSDGRMMYAPASGGPIWPVDPYDIIDCWGDSLTAGAGSVGSGAGQGPFPKQLFDRIGSLIISAVNNRGVGGQISQEIEARHGGTPALITVTGNQIPASGPVTVTAYDVDLLRGSGVSGILTRTGTLAGVPGTLSGSGGGTVGQSTYTFTRTAAGGVVACPPNTPFIPDQGVESRPRVQIFTYGRNDGTSAAGTNAILAALAAGIAYQTAYLPRYLVGGTLAAPGENLTPFNTQRDAIAAAHPGRFVDLNAVPTAGEMAIIGFVPDSYGAYSNGRTDAQDLAAGYVPSGMRSGATTGNGDFLHLNNFGYALWALRYYRAIVSMGWFPSLPII